jgi:GTP-binding protein EngB required for normal cell division
MLLVVRIVGYLLFLFVIRVITELGREKSLLDAEDGEYVLRERDALNKIRVLVFGATGTGKTSLCNTLTERSRPTDNGARGITAKSHVYLPFEFEGQQIELVDTAGLHESSHGTVPAEQAVLEIVELLEKARDGFSLLIHVTRASRITKDQDDDYNFFVEKMTQNEIPVILAVTGCENEHPMQSWVKRNQREFFRYGYKEIVPCCFGAGGPLEAHFGPLRAQSRELLVEAILKHSLTVPRKIYGGETGNSFSEALTRVWNEFVELTGLPQKYRRKVNESAYELLKRIGVSKTIARAAVMHIPDLLEEIGNKVPVPGAGKLLKMLSRLALSKVSRESR